MRIVLLAILLALPAFGQETNNQDPMRAATSALSSIPAIKQKMKEWEKKLWYYIPLDKDYAAAVGGVGNVLIQGRVSTREFKNLDMDFFGGKVRADFQYDFKQDAAESYINCRWDL